MQATPKKGLVLSERQRIEGFTLVELLVVISIISILAVVGMVTYSSVQKKARITKRIEDLKAIQTALELYYSVNKKYPIANGAGNSECNDPTVNGNLNSYDVIPGLVPTYMPSFPADPQMNKSVVTNENCYIYYGVTGSDYKLLDHRISEFSAVDYFSQRNLVDPKKDGGSSDCIVENGGTPWAWAIWSSCGTSPCSGSCSW